MNQESILAAVDALNAYICGRNIADFQIQTLKNDTLCLIGSFDLSYYHDLELVITGVNRLCLCTYFYVDLQNPAPFSVQFPPGGGAVLRFTDESDRKTEEIHFEGRLLVHTKHVAHEKGPSFFKEGSGQ